MDLFLKGKTALIFAGTRGIGRATAELFALEGCNVAISSRNQDNVDNTLNDLSKITGSIYGRKCDVADLDDSIVFIDEVKNKFGDVDILVHNSGGPSSGYFEDFKIEDWDFAYNLLLRSVIKTTNHILPGMKNKKWGRIINITSLSVKQPFENLILSTTFRTGLTGMVKTLSQQVAEYNITINNVAPGFIKTGRLEHLASEIAKQSGNTIENVLESMADSVPAKRIGKPAEVASLIVFLASELAGYITGSTINIDGGRYKGLL